MAPWGPNYEPEDKPAIKPPLGIKPHKLWLEERFTDIHAAILRYAEAEIPIPVKWAQEAEILTVQIINYPPTNETR